MFSFGYVFQTAVVMHMIYGCYLIIFLVQSVLSCHNSCIYAKLFSDKSFLQINVSTPSYFSHFSVELFFYRVVKAVNTGNVFFYKPEVPKSVLWFVLAL